MAKDTFYFTHDYGARNDPKLQNLLMQMGQEGKGIYWDLIELLYEQGGYLDLKNLGIIAFSLRTKTELLEKVVKSFDLFEIRKSLFFSKAVLERLKIKQEKSETARMSIEKRWKKDGNTNVIRTNKDDDTNVIRTNNERNTNVILERKVVKGKEKKVVKVKEKDKDIFFKEKNNKKEIMPGAKPGVNPEVKPWAKPEEPVLEAEKEKMPEAKLEVKPEVKPLVKPEAKPLTSPVVKPEEPVLEAEVACSRQGGVFEYFNSVYKKSIGIKYAYRATDFINLARKIKEFGEDIVKQKIDKFYVLCSSAEPPQWWHKGGMSDFTIENLIRHWNKIVDIESSANRDKRHLEELTDKKLKERGLMV